MTPENAPDDWVGMTERPISRWSKMRILEEAEACGIASEVLDRMAAIRLEDLRLIALRPTATVRTGKTETADRWRWTTFYALDLDALRALGE